MRIAVATDIGRPVAAVWRWYAVDHVRNHPRWDPNMEFEQVTAGPMRLGTRVRRRNRHFEHPIKGEMEVVEWKPESLMGVRIRDANMETHGRATFEAMAPNRMRLTIEADFLGMDQATADRIRPLMDRTARNIRQLVESEV